MLEPETNSSYFFKGSFLPEDIEQLISHLISVVDDSLNSYSLDKLSLIPIKLTTLWLCGADLSLIHMKSNRFCDLSHPFSQIVLKRQQSTLVLIGFAISLLIHQYSFIFF